MLGEKKIFSELLTQWYFIFTITCKLLLKFQVTSVAATYWDSVSGDEKQLQPRLRERLARCSRSTFSLTAHARVLLSAQMSAGKLQAAWRGSGQRAPSGPFRLCQGPSSTWTRCKNPLSGMIRAAFKPHNK